VEDWRILHNEELHKLYPSPNITRRMRWVENVARVGKMRNAVNIMVENLNGSDLLEDPGVDGKVVFERILWK